MIRVFFFFFKKDIFLMLERRRWLLKKNLWGDCGGALEVLEFEKPTRLIHGCADGGEGKCGVCMCVCDL